MEKKGIKSGGFDSTDNSIKSDSDSAELTDIKTVCLAAIEHHFTLHGDRAKYTLRQDIEDDVKTALGDTVNKNTEAILKKALSALWRRSLRIM